MKQQNGYIALMTVIIISAVVLGIATTISLLAIGEGQSALALSKGEDTLTFVEGCMEDALEKARNSNAYAGGTITRPEGTCNITVSKAGNVWTITVTQTATAYQRKIQTVVTRGVNLIIASWKEL